MCPLAFLQNIMLTDSLKDLKGGFCDTDGRTPSLGKPSYKNMILTVFS